MKMASMLDMIEFIEYGDQKVFRFHGSCLSIEDYGSMMDIVSVFALNIQITFGLMILLPVGQETGSR